MQTGSTPVYTDLQSMAALRSEARINPDQALDEVASQFESLFVQMMLKSMRDATIDGGLFDSNQLDTYQQMFDQQLALDLSSRGGVGLADMLVQQMGDHLLLNGEPRQGGDKPVSNVDTLAGSEHTLRQARRQLLQSSTPPGQTPSAGAASNEIKPSPQEQHADAAGLDAATAWLPNTPLEYIEDVWQHASEAAQQLGVDPAVLVAQSALETGWGRKVTTGAGGGSSFNLFNIKAGQSWSGEIAQVSTLEFDKGVAAMEKAAFRVYDSLADAFADYVDLLKSSPRYQKALEVAADSKQFLQELQRAGYATDPGYAEKILGILDQENYQSVLSTLKKF